MIAGRRLLEAVLLAALLVLLLQGCDSQAARKRLETDVVGSVKVSKAYRLIDSFEEGNGGGGPVAIYQALGPTKPRASDVVPPAGYSNAITDVPMPDYASWVPVLNRNVRWKSLAFYTGTSAGAECSIAVNVSVGEPQPILQVSAACSIVP